VQGRPDDGKPTGTFDVFDDIDLCRDHYATVGLGADYVDRLIR
jgi:2,4'-dihydroxyacetophenone dioxygenase